MEFSYHDLKYKLSGFGLWPTSWLARNTLYVLALDLFLFVVQKLLTVFRSPWGESLGGWITALNSTILISFVILGYRWLKSRILWRLRNRLIVTYMFIGVIPVVLLVTLAMGSFYLFAGQFASYVVTSDIGAQLRSIEAVNSAIANELAARLEHGEQPTPQSLEGLRKRDPNWAYREVCAWEGEKPLPMCSGPSGSPPFSRPVFADGAFREIVRDHGNLYLRAATLVPVRAQKLVVISSDPLDKDLVKKIADDLGEITMYASGLNLSRPGDRRDGQAAGASNKAGVVPQQGPESTTAEVYEEALRPTFTVGSLGESRSFDRVITFGTPLSVLDWQTGEPRRAGALMRVQTRPSILYERLFAALGDFSKGVAYILAAVAIFFGVIELLALLIGTGLTRSITRAVAQLYLATKHINRGDFSHRIPVSSKDQLAELANSFNSMTASIEQLIDEQKEKQRLQNELTIAQEVQAQLFPKEVSQLESLEVHGFCRPARTVSGDYYDFLTVNSDKLLLAVGDISGKGISAALLMATIHSAVRAYSIESTPVLREPVAVGAVAGLQMMTATGLPGGEVSPAALLSLLNHQLYESTPPEKYATLFLAIYDAQSRQLTYSNGGHLPPVIIGDHGSLRRLDCGGMVVGLFDTLSFEEAAVQLQPGEIFIAYSDGVTEPENEYGEFGEQRLIDLVHENRHLPLVRITEIVTAAVDDWIGPHEQPDDVTLVLARAR
jgi:phosphoserine phosphatase RsbU/P